MKRNNSGAGEGNRTFDYLVGGFRVTVGDESNTPGPRTHITGSIGALENLGFKVRLFIVSSFPFMGRFARISQNDYKDAQDFKIWIADIIRMVAALWCGLVVFARTLVKPAPEIIYERSAVLQSLTSFHAKKRHAVRIVEANGILSRETARDRKVLKVERLAALLERHVMQSADIIVAVSANLKNEIVSFAGVPYEKVVVVPNGVDKAIQNVATETDNDVLRFGFVGSIVKWQHLDRLIRAFVRVARDRRKDINQPELLLEIIGDGAELEVLKRIVRELDAERLVEFPGKLSHQESLSRMATWDVGLAGHEKSSSSKMYHSPLKLYEYAGLGLSILCTYSADAIALRHSGVPVYFYSNEDDLRDALFICADDASQRSANEKDNQRAVVAGEHTWENRADMVLAAIKSRSV